MGGAACRHTLNDLIEAQNDNLEPARLAALRAHLAGCPLCAQVADLLDEPDTLPDAPSLEPDLTAHRTRDHEEDDDDPDDRPAPFSLLDKLLAAHGAPQGSLADAPVLEVIWHHGAVVRELGALAPRKTFRLPPLPASVRRRQGGRGAPLARLGRDGQIAVTLSAELSGILCRAVEGAPMQKVKRISGEGTRLLLRPGELLLLRRGADGFVLRHGYPPALRRRITARGRPGAEEARARRAGAASLGTSLGCHAAVLLALFIAGVVSPAPRSVELDPDPDWRPVFLPEVQPEPAQTPSLRERPVDDARVSGRVEPQRRARRRDRSDVLAVVDKLARRSGAAGNQSLTVALRSVDAIKVPGGNASYKVGGLSGHGPRAQLGGAGGGVETRGLDSMLRERGGGPGQLGRLETGAVRGRARVVSRARKLPPPTVMSREAIARVVNRGLGQIQLCYERQLLKRPTLAGKVVFEWQIDGMGRVVLVKTVTSTLPDAQAVRCMIDRVRGWRFPRPKGPGKVVVTYPFVFAVDPF